MRRRLALILLAGAGLLPLALAADDKPGAKADDKKAEKAAKVAVPYRLTGTNHLMVRAKINGKGPFNLIVDTGAPAVFITKGVAKKAGAEPDKKDMAAFERAYALIDDGVTAWAARIRPPAQR